MSHHNPKKEHLPLTDPYYFSSRPECWLEPLLIIPFLSVVANGELVKQLESIYPNFNLIRSAGYSSNQTIKTLTDKGETVIWTSRKGDNFGLPRIESAVNMCLGSKNHMTKHTSFYEDSGVSVAIIMDREYDWIDKPFLFGVDFFYSVSNFLSWVKVRDLENISFAKHLTPSR